MIAGRTSIVTARSPVKMPLVARNVTVIGPSPVSGVPLTAPLLGSIDIHEGASTSDQVYGGSPPEALTEPLYAVPTVAVVGTPPVATLIGGVSSTASE